MPTFADFVPPDKVCSVCSQPKPLDASHFHQDKASPDGFRDECIPCRSQKRKRQQDMAIDDRLALLDKAALNMLSDVAHRDYSRLPHIGEVFECLMRVFGGPMGYAQHTLGTYLTANPGSQQRVKILSIMAMMANQVTQSGAAKVPKEYLSDEDLEQEIKKIAVGIFKPEGEQEVA
jgi:hypothetical protein